MKGKIKQAKGYEGADPYGFEIEGEDGGKYFAHLGDLKKNEELLYEVYKKKENKEDFKDGDEVEFEPWKPTDRKHAYHVKKV